jgi:hypothetical protein
MDDEVKRKSLFCALVIAGLIFALPVLLMLSRTPAGLNWWPETEKTIGGIDWMQRVAEEAEKARQRSDPAFQRPDLRDKDDKKR